MSEILIKNAVAREKGYLYFIDKDGNLCRAEMVHKGRPRKIKNEN